MAEPVSIAGWKKWSLCLGALAASGCTTVGPSYTPPSIAVPARFPEEGAAQARLAAQELATWWTRFEDKQLDRLIALALERNLDMREASSRIREARAREIIAGAAGRPRLDATGEAGHNRISENAGFTLPGETPGGLPGLPGSDFATFRIGFDASWEIDLWSGTKRAVEAAKARTEAEQWRASDVQVTLVAEVARQYFDLRALQRRGQIARAAIAAQREIGEVVAAQARNGLVSVLETEQQRERIAQAEAAVPPLEAEAKVRIQLLALLLGRFPEELAASADQEMKSFALPPAVPVGLPSELLLRRPDIRAAERRAAAATADIGVATADLYPRLSLTGAVQLVSTSLARLISADSIQTMIGGALRWPLLDGGRNRAEVDIAEERRNQALIGYERTVLAAFKDVAGALSHYQREGERVMALEARIAAARDAAATTRARYRNGLTGSRHVLERESALLLAEDELAASQAQQIQYLVALYKALGGGWSEQQAAASPAGRK